MQCLSLLEEKLQEHIGNGGEQMRAILLKRLQEDLIGPHAEDEVLATRPSDVYLTGILWPRDARMGAEEDERFGLSGTERNERDGGGEDEEVSLAGQSRPCSAGMSFAARTIRRNNNAKVDVSINFATYKSASPAESTTERRWQRHAYDISIDGVKLQTERPPPSIDLKRHGGPANVKLHLRTASWSDRTLATITLLNLAQVDKNDGRDGIEQLTLFQVRIEIRPHQGTLLVARPLRRVAFDEDDRSAELLYRDAREFANGHTCSVEWKSGAEPETASMVATSWLPTTKVHATSTIGHQIFHSLRENSEDNPLSARWLATADKEKLANALQRLPAAYGKWIKTKEIEAMSLDKKMLSQAEKNIAACRDAHVRMNSGAMHIASNTATMRAFQLANLAMDTQYNWDREKSKRGSLVWRPFQLGFILLTAASIADRHHPERKFMDLLWFPTGGGKTEAYLALIAFLAFYRRLSTTGDPDEGGGVAAIMRYTLRLLTTQQFVRATSVLLACEAIRRGCIPSADVSPCELGHTPFSIGLWVGRDAVPNTVSDAAAALRGTAKSASGQPTPKQLVRCPACNGKLAWQHSRKVKAIHVRCEDEKCLLFDHEAPLPVWVVDEDVYREHPTLLIGTVDKFAQIVRRKEINNLFGLNTGQPPDLILQDELHLISGPLGTISGLYEVAIDHMFSSKGARPKIIGSTATIRRASEQVASLFDRKAVQFPPPCIDANDSAFAVTDQNAPGRIYAGITTAGRSAKFTLQAVATSLLQSVYNGIKDDLSWDPYWTLVSYFNSLRELGGALVLMQDDVNKNLALLAQKREEKARRPKLIEELTSRRTQAEIRDMLDRLAIRFDAQDSDCFNDSNSLDVVLATNMLSVGVDIPRLGLMLVNGQPKGIAEYVQATSRVGRGDVPGLIVAVLNNAKARDRSHYENFPIWHRTLYRDVEPTSVTPFASRARDRVLHAILVALVRHLVPGMLDNPKLNNDAIDVAKKLIDAIVERAKAVDPEEKDIKSELERHLKDWESRSPTSYWSPEKDSLLQDAERAATHRATGQALGEGWPTLNSMRSVEASTPFRLAERLSQKLPGRNNDGK